MENEEATKDQVNHFLNRTHLHIKLVQKYCALIEKAFPYLLGFVDRGVEHDLSKFEELERIPYVWLTWRYKCKDDGVKCNLPEGMDKEIDAATEHHILNNAHHPEFHQSETESLLNPRDRDAPPEKMIDATGMSSLDLAEMVADWCAMSEERGNAPKEWAKKNVNVRWKFKADQEKLIYEMMDAVWNKGV